MDAGWSNRLWEVTIPYGVDGKVDTGLSFTLQENEDFYLRSYLFGIPGLLGDGEGFASLAPVFARDREDLKELDITVGLDHRYENAAVFLEEQGNGIKKIREDLYYEAAEDETSTYDMYKLVPGGASEKMEDCLIVKLYCFQSAIGAMSPEEAENMLVQASDCITGDTGAPYLQDLLCTLNFGGVQIRNLLKIGWFEREFTQEGKEICRTVKFLEGEADQENIDAMYLKQTLTGESGTEAEADEEQSSPISIFGKDYQYREGYEDVVWLENGVTYRLALQKPEIWKDPRGALTILAERYLKPLDRTS